MSTHEASRLDRAALRFQISIAEEILRGRPDDTDALRTLSHAYALAGRLEAALETDRRLVACLPRDIRARYNLACRLALNGLADEALRELGSACDLGFDDLDLMSNDPDLEVLRGEEAFGRLQVRLARGHDAS